MLNLFYLLIENIPFVMFFIGFASIAISKPKFWLMFVLFYSAFNSLSLGLDLSKFSLTLFSFQFYFYDFISIVSLVSALFTMSTGSSSVQKSRFFLYPKLLLVLTTMGVLFWLSSEESSSSLNVWRQYILAVSLLIYASYTKRKWETKDLHHIFFLPGFFVTLFTLILSVFNGIGTASGFDPLTGEASGRIANAQGAFLILISILSSLFLSQSSKRIERFYPLLGALTLILLQHRTIWFVIFGLFAYVFVEKGKYFNISKLSIFFASTFFMASFAIILYFNRNIFYSATNDGTWGWRVNKWAQSLEVDRNPVNWVFGSLLGPSPVTSNAAFSFASHSHYVEMIEWQGIFGLSAYLLFIFSIWKSLKRHETILRFGRVSIVSTLIYSITYAAPSASFILLGLLSCSIRKGCLLTERTNILESARRTT